MKKTLLSLAAVMTIGSMAQAKDYLVQLTPEGMQSFEQFKVMVSGQNNSVENLNFNNWVQVKMDKELTIQSMQSIESSKLVERIQPNYKLSLLKNPQLLKINQEKALKAFANKKPEVQKESDNPAIPAPTQPGSGSDPLFNQQWGMQDIEAKNGWKSAPKQTEMVVAVIDTGVDYTHEDLVDNLWRNPGETGRDAQGRDKATNGVDDDNNGFVDDTIGWDFVTNDNKPYDLKASMFEMIMGGGNPGHGTHCAGNVAARGDNGKGIAGVAPNVKIMSIRFLSEKGQGTTADAIKSIKYAVDNGAHILSNSWGSEGEDNNSADNKALKDIIRYSQSEGRLFVAAAGNGRQGGGYNNDTDSRPAFPASYDMDIIVSVAAIDVNDNLGSFSNWGKRTVDIGAPGVKVFSTTVGSKYDDKVMSFLGQEIYWDGTSMATPHVAGAAALYWSTYPNKTWQEVKQALLSSAVEVPALRGKVSSDGKLNVNRLMTY